MGIFQKAFHKVSYLLVASALSGNSLSGAPADPKDRSLDHMKTEGANLLAKEGYKADFAGVSGNKDHMMLVYDLQGKGQTTGLVSCDKGKPCRIDNTYDF